MKTELEMLEDCIQSGKLDDTTLAAFEGMASDLESGKWARLTVRQRDWLNLMHERLGLDPGAANLVSSGAMKVSNAERQGLKKFIDSLGPRPLKPPGRRA